MKKIIHYFYDDINIWKRGVAPSFRICYASWLKFCPDYEIKLWHMNMPEFQEMLSASRFLRECYNRKMWAFVSDYVRYYALYNYGGIYLDTDVQLLKSFDEYLDKECFCSIEGDIRYGRDIPESAVMGGSKGHQLFKKVLDYYNSEQIFETDYFIAPVILGNILFEMTGFEKIVYSKEYQEQIQKFYNSKIALMSMDNFNLYQNQQIYKNSQYNIEIYPSQYFCPCWNVFKQEAFTEKTVAIHWNQSSWWEHQKFDMHEIRSYRYKNKIQRYWYLHSERVAKIFTFAVFNKKLRRDLREKIKNLWLN